MFQKSTMIVEKKKDKEGQIVMRLGEDNSGDGHEQDLTLSGSYLIMKNCVNDERDYGGYHAKGRKWLGTSGRGERGGS
ncbi:hypothetical protein GJ496_011708 [Pomphorhynchus laevis]|nr:hypothetical protein GJ496_011708 [Pomphorhynchus laevis]